MTTAVKTYSQTSGNRKVSLDLVPSVSFTTDKLATTHVVDVKSAPSGEKLISVNGALHETVAMLELENKF